MRFNIEKNIGHKINKLTLLGRGGTVGNGVRKVRLACDCGKEICIVLNSFLYGKTKSCGCFRNNENTRRNSTHGLTKHPLYIVWGRIIQRCEDKNDKSYKRYGAKGVKMCDEWRSDFLSFYNWAISNGWRRGLQIDKDIIPMRLGLKERVYSPQMCCFVTNKENANHRGCSRFLFFNGENLTISQWSSRVGIGQSSISARLKKGWSVEQALTIPIGVYSGSNKIVKANKNINQPPQVAA